MSNINLNSDIDTVTRFRDISGKICSKDDYIREFKSNSDLILIIEDSIQIFKKHFTNLNSILENKNETSITILLRILQFWHNLLLLIINYDPVNKDIFLKRIHFLFDFQYYQ